LRVRSLAGSAKGWQGRAGAGRIAARLLMEPGIMTTPAEVLEFWLGEIGPESWHLLNPELIGECRERFGDLVEAAAAQGLEHWVHGPAGTLAYLLLTDFLPRLIHGNDIAAFSADMLARNAAGQAIGQGWDLVVPEPDRQFFYLPFSHSEQPCDQDLALQLAQERLTDTPESQRYAAAQHAIIARFGRFPDRNAALGRETTAQERDFLAQAAVITHAADLTADLAVKLGAGPAVGRGGDLAEKGRR
jgi:uncharacterized protein (DUF924 family)